MDLALVSLPNMQIILVMITWLPADLVVLCACNLCKWNDFFVEEYFTDLETIKCGLNFTNKIVCMNRFLVVNETFINQEFQRNQVLINTFKISWFIMQYWIYTTQFINSIDLIRLLKINHSLLYEDYKTTWILIDCSSYWNINKNWFLWTPCSWIFRIPSVQLLREYVVSAVH